MLRLGRSWVFHMPARHTLANIIIPAPWPLFHSSHRACWRPQTQGPTSAVGEPRARDPHVVALPGDVCAKPRRQRGCMSCLLLPPRVTDNCRHSRHLWRHPRPSICLIGEELTIPVHWEGMPRLIEVLADTSGPLCLLSWAVPMPVQPLPVVRLA